MWAKDQRSVMQRWHNGKDVIVMDSGYSGNDRKSAIPVARFGELLNTKKLYRDIAARAQRVYPNATRLHAGLSSFRVKPTLETALELEAEGMWEAEEMLLDWVPVLTAKQQAYVDSGLEQASFWMVMLGVFGGRMQQQDTEFMAVLTKLQGMPVVRDGDGLKEWHKTYTEHLTLLRNVHGYAVADREIKAHVVAKVQVALYTTVLAAEKTATKATARAIATAPRPVIDPRLLS